MDVTPEFVLKIALNLLIAFGILAAGLTLAAVFIFKGHNLSGQSLALIVQRTEIAKVATIVLIILTVAFLGLLKIVEGEAVVAVLSGIAGYVLGGRTKDGRTEANGET